MQASGQLKVVAKYLIVDAHSVIFAWKHLRAMHSRRNVLAREALVKALTEYQDFTGVRVVVVFDGQGAKPSELTEPGGIQIFYSASGQTADDVIERLASKYGREHDLTVATDDLLEQDTVASFGATCVSSDVLRLMLEENHGDVQRELKRRKKE